MTPMTPLFLSLLMGAMGSTAHAWEPGPYGATGSSVTYTSTFPSAVNGKVCVRDSVTNSAGIWTSCPSNGSFVSIWDSLSLAKDIINSSRIPGGKFDLKTPNAQIPFAQSCGQNLVNEVCSEDEPWFVARGMGGASYHIRSFLGYRDVILNRDGVAWSEMLPQDHPVGRQSPDQVLLHILLQRVGLGVENDVLATMNEFYPHGGTLNDEIDFNEDDYVGILALHPGDSSSNCQTWTCLSEQACDSPLFQGTKVVGLSQFLRSGVGESASDWQEGPAQFSLSSGWLKEPAPVSGNVRTCTTVNNVQFQWFLSTVEDCPYPAPSGEQTLIVGTRTPGQGSNLPYTFGPYQWNMSGASVARSPYFLCAGVEYQSWITSREGYVEISP